MTTEDLLRAIGSVDEKELAHAQRKTVKPIIWIITALVLAAALLLPILLIRREKPLAHTVLAEKPSWNMDADIYIQPEQLMCALTGTPAWEADFASSLTVHARLINALPDTYAIPEKTLARDNYRVLQLEVVETVVGKDVPQEIWFLLPEHYAADLAGLDLLIALDQVGVENYLLFNTTRQQYETFSLVFSVGVLSHEQEPLQEYAPDPTAVSTDMRLSILPFKDNALCWPAGEAWSYLGRHFTSCVTNVDTTTPIDPAPTLEEAKSAVRRARETEYFQKFPQARVRHADEFNPSVELAGFNTEQGSIFSQVMHQYENKLLLCRVIDGFYASECYIYHDDGRIIESDVKFSPADIAALPKLTPVVQQVLERAPENGTCRKLIGYYYKTDNGDLFGVVQAAWEVSGQPVLSVNVLVTTDGTVSQISDETLQACHKGEITPDQIS